MLSNKFGRVFSASCALFATLSIQAKAFTVTALSGSVPIITFTADGGSETIHPSSIVSEVAPYKNSGVIVRFSGHFVLLGELEFDGYSNLTLTSSNSGSLEQTNAYNDSAVFRVVSSSDVTISNLTFGGSGTPRPDGAAPQQNAIRISDSASVVVEDCIIEPSLGSGTHKHAITIVDSSDTVTVQRCDFANSSAGAVMATSSIWPHPTEPGFGNAGSVGHFTARNNNFEHLAVPLVMEERAHDGLMEDNTIENIFGHGFVVEDGAHDFVISGNTIDTARGAAVVIGNGQSGQSVKRGVISSNTAIGVNNPSIVVPSPYYGVWSVDQTFQVSSDAKTITLSDNNES